MLYTPTSHHVVLNPDTGSITHLDTFPVVRCPKVEFPVDKAPGYEGVMLRALDP